MPVPHLRAGGGVRFDAAGDARGLGGSTEEGLGASGEVGHYRHGNVRGREDKGLAGE